jgi:hypothetical protein
VPVLLPAASPAGSNPQMDLVRALEQHIEAIVNELGYAIMRRREKKAIQ